MLRDVPGHPTRWIRHEILGCPVDALTQADALTAINDFVAQGHPHHIVTVNPEYVMLAHRDSAFLQVLQSADMATADGAGLLLAARVLGFRLPQRVTGNDIVAGVARCAAVRGWRLFLLGAAPGVARAAAVTLQTYYPSLVIAGTMSGSPAANDVLHIVEQVTTVRPDVLLVAFGAPRQDLWIAAHKQALGVPVAIGVGGAFDFLAGVQRRAPLLLQQAGLEWAYRLWREPYRWRRMLALPAFLAHVLRERTQGKRWVPTKVLRWRWVGTRRENTRR